MLGGRTTLLVAPLLNPDQPDPDRLLPTQSRHSQVGNSQPLGALRQWHITSLRFNADIAPEAIILCRWILQVVLVIYLALLVRNVAGLRIDPL